MKKIIYLALFYLFIVNCFAQNTINNKSNESQKYILRSTLGSNGFSKIITGNSGTYYVSQSVGQASVIGTFSKKNYTIRQGFQQPLLSLQKIYLDTESDLKANLYPNPFIQSINVVFDEKISNELTVVMYNLSGMVMLYENYTASQKITIPTEFLPKGDYILKISVENKQLIAKIIKL